MSSDSNEMSFLDHLEALRWHLIRSAIAVILLAIVAFIFKNFLFDGIVFAQLDGDFVTYRALCKASFQLHEWLPDIVPQDGICIGQNLPKLQAIGMASMFFAHIIGALVAGLVVAFPYVFWEIWRFISPALKPGERNVSRGVVASVSLLFMLGVIFGYFIIAPLSVNFFLTYDLGDKVFANPQLSSYISILLTIVLACGFVFELPVLIYFLSKLGIVTPLLLRKFRKHALVAALILSAIITPPDIFSQLLVSIPLLILYEISIWLSARVVKKEEKKHQQTMES